VASQLPPLAPSLVTVLVIIHAVAVPHRTLPPPQIFLVTCAKADQIRQHLETLDWPVVECREGSPRRGRSRTTSTTDDVSV
jgi:hypothetical protein